MEYDRIILELMDRIKILEDKVDTLLRERNVEKGTNGETTEQIRAYILQLFARAREAGLPSVIIVANEVHKALGLTSRVPSVCNAMKRLMREGDEELRKTPSGFSTTYTVKYYLN